MHDYIRYSTRRDSVLIMDCQRVVYDDKGHPIVLDRRCDSCSEKDCENRRVVNSLPKERQHS